jgi:hypothetical protein
MVPGPLIGPDRRLEPMHQILLIGIIGGKEGGENRHSDIEGHQNRSQQYFKIFSEKSFSHGQPITVF